MDPEKLPGAQQSDRPAEMPTNVPEEPKKSLGRKLLWGGLFTLLLAIAIIGVIWAGKHAPSSPGSNDQSSETPTKAPEPDLGWNRFFDSENNFSIDAPEIARTITDKKEMATVGYLPTCNTDTGIVCVYLPDSTFPKTNFNGAGVSVNITGDNSAGSCTAKKDYEREATSTLVIGGITFAGFNASDAATSHQSMGNDYRTYRNGKCYEITTRLNTSTFEVYAAGTITRFTDEEKLTTERILNKIVSSFSFTK